MKDPFLATISLTLILLVSVLSAQAEELLNYNNVSISVGDNYQCQPQARVRLDASSEESYRNSRVDMQKLSEVVKTYLWLDCKELESVEFDAYVKGSEERVYLAKVEKKNEWFLQEEDIDAATAKEESGEDETTPVPEVKSKSAATDEPTKPAEPKKATVLAQSAVRPKGKYESLEALEESAKTSEEAQLDLAKGLLDLPGKDDSIEFPADDTKRGLELLEKLASAGNPDAMQILSEAYAPEKKFDLNIPLIEALTGRPLTSGNEQTQRGTASASLTLEAAANGSERAVDSLEEAGRAGSTMSYYALGMMYLLDKAKKMPYQKDFLSGQLNMNISGTGGAGNVDVGLHFLTLAAEGGDADAQELLTDMEVEFKPPSSGSGSSSNSSGISAAVSSNPSTSSSSGAGLTPTTATTASASQAAGSQAQAVSAKAPAGQAPSGQRASESSVEYSEALIASGALSDILDSRSKADAAASSAQGSGRSSAQRNSGTASGGGTGSTGRGSSAASAAQSAGSATGAGSRSGGRGANTSQSSTRRSRTTSSPPGNMNSEQNEAEIID